MPLSSHMDVDALVLYTSEAVSEELRVKAEGKL